MKILVQQSGKNIQLLLPTNLLCNEFLLKYALKHSNLHLEEKAGDAARQIAREIHRIKKRYGHWELVEVHSADGETVKITL